MSVGLCTTNFLPCCKVEFSTRQFLQGYRERSYSAEEHPLKRHEPSIAGRYSALSYFRFSLLLILFFGPINRMERPCVWRVLFSVWYSLSGPPYISTLVYHSLFGRSFAAVLQLGFFHNQYQLCFQLS